VRRRLDVGEIELGHLAHRVEDRSELLAHVVDLALGNLEARQAGHMQNVLSRDCHVDLPYRPNLKRDGPRWRGPVSGLLELRD
jgi:hypothetical protein